MTIYAFADEASASIDKQMEAMKRNGLQGLEIRNVDGVNVSDITLEKAKEVHEKMEAAGLKVWSIGSPLGKIGIEAAFEPHLEKLKHTLEVAKILESKYNLKKVITHTTRKIRVGEVNHVDYHFVDKDEFLTMKSNNEFVETAIYNDNFYGTSKKEVEDIISDYENMIDIQKCMKKDLVKKHI